MQENKPTIVFCPYHKYFDRHCSWSYAPAYRYEPLSESMKKEIDAVYGKIEILPNGVKSFSADTNTGFYLKDGICLRKPKWLDVWKVIKNWIVGREQKFRQLSLDNT